MIVVSDTGPLNYLLQIARVDLLHTLFGTVVIPQEVLAELSAPGAPEVVRVWSTNPPSWLSVQVAGTSSGLKGEWAAMELALQIGCTLLCDDDPARRSARKRGIEVRGTLGVLQEAHLRGLLDLPQALSELLGGTNFYVTKDLVDRLLAQTAEIQEKIENSER